MSLQRLLTILILFVLTIVPVWAQTPDRRLRPKGGMPSKNEQALEKAIERHDMKAVHGFVKRGYRVSYDRIYSMIISENDVNAFAYLKENRREVFRHEIGNPIISPNFYDIDSAVDKKASAILLRELVLIRLKELNIEWNESMFDVDPYADEFINLLSCLQKIDDADLLVKVYNNIVSLYSVRFAPEQRSALRLNSAISPSIFFTTQKMVGEKVKEHELALIFTTAALTKNSELIRYLVKDEFFDINVLDKTDSTAFDLVRSLDSSCTHFLEIYGAKTASQVITLEDNPFAYYRTLLKSEIQFKCEKMSLEDAFVVLRREIMRQTPCQKLRIEHDLRYDVMDPKFIKPKCTLDGKYTIRELMDNLVDQVNAQNSKPTPLFWTITPAGYSVARSNKVVNVYTEIFYFTPFIEVLESDYKKMFADSILEFRQIKGASGFWNPEDFSFTVTHSSKKIEEIRSNFKQKNYLIQKEEYPLQRHLFNIVQHFSLVENKTSTKNDIYLTLSPEMAGINGMFIRCSSIINLKKYLLQTAQQFDINQQVSFTFLSPDKYAPLFFFCPLDSLSPDLIATLVKMGMNPEARDWNGNTYLHRFYCSPNLLKHLIKVGFDINAKNNQGETPLLFALKDLDVKSSRVIDLLKMKANPYIRNDKGVNAFTFLEREIAAAAEPRKTQLSEILEYLNFNHRRKSDPSMVSPKNPSPR